VPVVGLEPTRLFPRACLHKFQHLQTYMTCLTSMDVTRYRYPVMASIHKSESKPNWFCHYYDPEGYRRKLSTGTENATVARTICVNIERAAILTRQGKFSNEKGLKLIRETCAAIGTVTQPQAGVEGGQNHCSPLVICSFQKAFQFLVCEWSAVAF